MPTGYTAGILDGKITTFPQFAKLCMRAFGATVHMRDDDMDSDYVPRTPSDYHVKEIEKAQKTLRKIDKMPSENIIITKGDELIAERKRQHKQLAKIRADKEAMNSILREVRKWQPPTDEHTGIKEFMIEQIVKTIDFDCDEEYYKKRLREIEIELACLDADDIRKSIKEKALYDLNYHIAEHDKELERCEKANRWVVDFIDSL